jgi:hypothetical protein
MDWLDWIVRVAGGSFGLLTLAFGFSRISNFTERDVAPIWWLAFIFIGTVWAVSLAANWMLPVSTTVYLANGSDHATAARIDGDIICIPGKSYDGFSYRLRVPKLVVVVSSAAGPEQRYPVGKGTWLINTSSEIVTADMYEPSSNSIEFDALMSNRQGVLHINSRFGRPFRMFSQAPLDRAYTASGDVVPRSIDGPCPAEKPGASGH